MDLKTSCLIIGLVFVITACGEQEGRQNNEKTASPITVIASEKKGFATFTHAEMPENRVGYRFFEHTPLVYENVKPIAGEEDPGLESENISKLLDDFSTRKGVLIHQKMIDQDSIWIMQAWTFYLAPVEDGIDLLFTVQTFDQGLPAYYGVQQCFRMSGTTNAAWRQAIACTPAFSEFDLWEKEKDKQQKTSLTYVLRNDNWEQLPADSTAIGARTPLGYMADMLQFGENLPARVGPYKARMTGRIDNGLITRVNMEKTWVCGIFWENTSHVSDHHPADCLHSIVNIGNIPAKAMRAIRGKIYWFKGSLDDLSAKYEKDF